MIKISREACPERLAAGAADGTKKYLAAPPREKPSPWNTEEVKEALRRECRGKCMYCEALPDDVAYGAIEHIKPKKLFPELVLAWENLGLACTRCNTNKGDYWSPDDQLRLLNPYEDDPTERILFSGPAAVAVLGDARAANTIRQLKLNRDQLFLARSKRQQDLDILIAIWHREQDPAMRRVAAQDIQQALEDDQEFAAALRAFAQWRGFDAAA